MTIQHDLCDIVNEAPHKQVIIIDTNIALHQIDALDHKCPATCLVIVLQTVLQVRMFRTNVCLLTVSFFTTLVAAWK